ncbi:MAG: hypothetical protein OXG53_17395 [Chloroflexi bacterium]|nr:hypothetical protein [Chloroflexota bacterium]
MPEDSNKYYLLSLGCAKNTVDSESMARVTQAGLPPTKEGA